MRTNILTNYLKRFTSILGNCRLNLGQREEEIWAIDLEHDTYS